MTIDRRRRAGGLSWREVVAAAAVLGLRRSGALKAIEEQADYILGAHRRADPKDRTTKR